MTGERELYFSDEFLPKFTERCMVVLDCIKNRTEIQESDWDVIETVHRIWFEGRLGWTKPVTDKTAEKTEQIGLFADKNDSSGQEKRQIDAHDDLGTAIAPPKTVKPKRKRR
jgi:hypothetical protein